MTITGQLVPKEAPRRTMSAGLAGGPAVVGDSLRPEALRHRLSTALPFSVKLNVARTLCRASTWFTELPAVSGLSQMQRQAATCSPFYASKLPNLPGPSGVARLKFQCRSVLQHRFHGHVGKRALDASGIDGRRYHEVCIRHEILDDVGRNASSIDDDPIWINALGSAVVDAISG